MCRGDATVNLAIACRILLCDNRAIWSHAPNATIEPCSTIEHAGYFFATIEPLTIEPFGKMFEGFIELKFGNHF